MRGRRVKLLEREAELDELVAALEGARGGAGRMVLLEGTAGIGKTRLLRAARDTAGRIGIGVLAARGTELERDFPFALVRQLFEPALLGTDQPRREELLEGAARRAAAVVGLETDAGGAGSDSPLDPSFETLNALYWLTSNLAEERPLLLAVDDVHWSDAPSLRFVRFLLPRLEDVPVLVVLAARPSEPGAESGLVAQLGADPAVHVLRPAPLSNSAVTEMIRAELSETADETFCAACYEATGGNPFILHELLVELKSQGSLGARTDAVSVREVVPVTIQRAVLGRLARICPSAQQLAQALAVLGEQSQPQLVAELAGLDRDDAAEAADALAAAGILEPGRPLRFVHPLVRGAIYSDLPGAAKSAAHQRAADLLIRKDAEPERIAVHLLATDPDGDPRVVEILNAAARRALDRAAPEVAVAYLRRALAQPPAPEARPDLLRLLARAYFRAGDRDGFDQLRESADFEQLTAAPQRLLSFADELSLMLYNWGRADEGVALLERASTVAIEAGDYDLAGRFQALLASWALLPPPEALARIQPFADRITPGSPTERLFLALRSFWGLLCGEPAREMIELARQAIGGGSISREVPDTPLLGWASCVLWLTDELAAAETANAELAGLPGGVLGAHWTALYAWSRAELAFRRGQIAEAEVQARIAVEAARQGGFLAAVPPLLATLVEILVERDELAAGEAELAAMGLDGAIPEIWVFVVVLLSRARLRLAHGEARRALLDLLAGRRISAHAGTQGRYHAAGSYLALALHGVGDHSQAHAVALQEVADARDYGLSRRLGVALRTLGVLEDGERGLDLLQESLSVLESSPAQLEHARSLAEYGAALRRANRRAEAREPLRAAFEYACHSGALAVARQAHQELVATGEKLGPLFAGGVESLTPSERRVAEMAAQGMANREIAQALFLTLKTIETHLSSAYRKLEIHSRADLPQALKPQPDAYLAS